MTEHFVDNSGVRIHAIELNSFSSEIPLIIIPGMINSAEEVAESVGQHLKRRTIMLSIRGRGQSDSPEFGWRVEDQASDVAAIINHFEFPNVVIFGHSTGSSIAARAVPMIEPQILGFIIGDFPLFYPAYSEKWAQRIRTMRSSMTEVALAGIVRDAKQTALHEYLRESASKILVLTGNTDRSILKPPDLERIGALLPGVHIEHLAECGHEFLSENPALSISTIERVVALWA